ncbi:MAG: hypothetical protein JWM40_676 [Frankiales bacterium]|nr:hypothetical protein [Frankiales bacterium]
MTTRSEAVERAQQHTRVYRAGVGSETQHVNDDEALRAVAEIAERRKGLLDRLAR